MSEVDGTPSAVAVDKFHTNSDLDGDQNAQHHTLGPGRFQAAPGSHTHDGSDSAELEGYLKEGALSGYAKTSDIDSAVNSALNSALSAKIKSGTISITGTGTTFAFLVQNFGSSFANVPTVVATSQNSNYLTAVTGVDKTKCTIWIRHHAGTNISTSTTISVTWIAVDI